MLTPELGPPGGNDGEYSEDGGTEDVDPVEGGMEDVDWKRQD